MHGLHMGIVWVDMWLRWCLGGLLFRDKVCGAV